MRLQTITNLRAKKMPTARNYSKRQLMKKSKSYFAKSRIIKKGRRRDTTVRYLVERTYDSLPKAIRDYLDENKESILTNMTNQIVAFKNNEVNVYLELYQLGVHARGRQKIGTKEELYSRLRSEYPDLFKVYLRKVQGYNPKEYFIQNVQLNRVSGSIIPAMLEFRDGMVLYMNLDYSGDNFEASIE